MTKEKFKGKEEIRFVEREERRKQIHIVLVFEIKYFDETEMDLGFLGSTIMSQ